MFPCEKDEAILKRDAILGKFGDSASMTIFFSSNLIKLSLDQQVQRCFPSMKLGVFLEQFHLLHSCSCFLELVHLLHSLFVTNLVTNTPSNGLQLVVAFKDPLCPFFAGPTKIAFINIIELHGNFNFK